jgi:hypothetical protein
MRLPRLSRSRRLVGVQGVQHILLAGREGSRGCDVSPPATRRVWTQPQACGPWGDIPAGGDEVTLECSSHRRRLRADVACRAPQLVELGDRPGLTEGAVGSHGRNAGAPLRTRFGPNRLVPLCDRPATVIPTSARAFPTRITRQPLCRGRKRRQQRSCVGCTGSMALSQVQLQRCARF